MRKVPIEERAKQFVTGWGLPAATFVVWSFVYLQRAEYEYTVYQQDQHPSDYTKASPALVIASIALIVIVGQRLYRSLNAHR